MRVRRMFSHDEGVPCVPQPGEGMDARTGGVSVSSYARVFELGVLLGLYHPPPAFDCLTLQPLESVTHIL